MHVLGHLYTYVYIIYVSETVYIYMLISEEQLKTRAVCHYIMPTVDS